MLEIESIAGACKSDHARYLGYTDTALGPSINKALGSTRSTDIRIRPPPCPPILVYRIPTKASSHLGPEQTKQKWGNLASSQNDRYRGEEGARKTHDDTSYNRHKAKVSRDKGQP